MSSVYVDVDDVLAQTGRMFLRLLAERFHRRVRWDDIRSYHLGESFGLGAEELERFMAAAHEPEALLSIEPMPGAAEALAAWLESGYEVLVITGRPPATREVTLEWLRDRGLPFRRFHLLDKYSEFYDGAHGTPEGALRLEDLAGFDLCFAVEDFPGTAGYLARSLSVPVALFDRPWNRGVEAGNGVVRCRDWGEVRECFDAASNPAAAETY